METLARSLEGGFANLVFDAQSIFRAVMDAMARPGRVNPVSDLAHPPKPLAAAAGAVILALCDQDTSVWLAPDLAASEAVKAWIGFHAGTPLVARSQEAAFAICAGGGHLPVLDSFKQGEQDYPDRSTTLVMQVESLTGGAELRLEGPGIESFETLASRGLPEQFVDQWRWNNKRFPRGVDVILAAPEGIACLPRTTRITAKEA
ncbi:Alpha-D-ribose 1-methylphosphonate 5-triphosphate synthase subunit PhnH [Hartmannibacter diazotrophicus]|uniref:Alpha-D-ribose 1-methylphosphonate 5-triphosphate synthase subunit PhnH n=1 Tax=Hartmannibacter diazotrophicus TaxID=1482074 RepID=A0A2C9D4V0_9HYPH|nr:phosphonate C-P lyase system protein PhnH [Hartmannibacter diazotrophicus]SON55316.1 Alpha-D-ribose 1-methylphosphonate 5-triphosphate synthase subunit PhnH [Hartmannibacter diazotrophicus]